MYLHHCESAWAIHFHALMSGLYKQGTLRIIHHTYRYGCHGDHSRTEEEIPCYKDIPLGHGTSRESYELSAANTFLSSPYQDGVTVLTVSGYNVTK
jgi:hypothetical protein